VGLGGLQQGCVQELAVVIAPKLLGGLAARTPLGALGFTAMDQVIPLQGLTLQQLERDVVVQSLVPPL
jgi:Pyrimidine reductase, riboflavin biosynthesis